MCEVIILRAALKELQSLPGSAVGHISSAIDGLATEPHPTGCKKLQGSTNLWRIRVGDYQVVYAIEDRIHVVEVRAVGHRKDIYG